MDGYLTKMQTYLEENPEFSRYEKELSTSLTKARYEHSLITAAISREIAGRHEFTEEETNNCVTAALLHDITKEQNKKTHETILAQEGQKEILNEYPTGVWHALSAAVYVKTRFSIQENDILDAIRFHTTGSPGMGKIAMCVYCADYFSSPYSNLEKIDLSASLEELCLIKARASITYLLEKNKPVHHDSIDFYHHLIGKLHD